MMKDSESKRFHDYNLHKRGFQFMLEDKSCLAQCSVKPVDLQLSADEFITHYFDDRFGKEFFPKNFSRGITVSDVDNNINLSLCLSIGQSKAKEYNRERNKCCASSSEVIDLEDPNFGFPKNNASHELPPRFSVEKSFSKQKHKLESFLQVGMNHIQYGSPARESVSDFSPRCQRPTSYSGHSEHHRDFPSTDLFFKNQTSRNCKPNNLDLNIVQFEYSSCMSNNFSMVQNQTSRTSFSGVITSASTSWNKADVIDLSDSCYKHREFDLNIDLITNSSGENNEGGWNNGVIDIDSDSGEPCSSNKSNPKIESVDSSSKIDCVDAEPHAQNEQKSCDNTESNVQYINNKKLEADETVQKAAESLVKIHSETRVLHQHGLGKECLASDSYEEMVLGVKESELDDLCVTSNAFVMDELENKASRYKLKRGTRMKDFQKDVLPSLAVLSRREISEDVNIMEGVIRSREYKKMRAKMGDGGESFRAGRSKRSRAGYNRRYSQ